MLPSIPPAHEGQRDGDAHAPASMAEPHLAGAKEKQPSRGSRRALGLGLAAPGRQSRRAGALLCRHGAAQGAQSVALIPPCPVRSQIPFTSMSACSVRPAPGETARGDGGEDLLKRHCF